MGMGSMGARAGAGAALPGSIGISRGLAHRASAALGKPIRPGTGRSSTSSGTGLSISSLRRDELAKIADEGIARRRAELRNLKTKQNVNAGNILARAKAMTMNAGHGSGSGGVSGSAGEGNTNGVAHQQPAYPIRTRPVSVPKSPPHSPPSQRSGAASTSSTTSNTAADVNNGNGNGNGNGPPRVTNFGMRLAMAAPSPAENVNTNGKSMSKGARAPPASSKAGIPTNTNAPFVASTPPVAVAAVESPVRLEPPKATGSWNGNTPQPISSPPLGPMTTIGGGSIIGSASASVGIKPPPTMVNGNHGNHTSAKQVHSPPSVPSLVEENLNVKSNSNGGVNAKVAAIEQKGVMSPVSPPRGMGEMGGVPMMPVKVNVNTNTSPIASTTAGFSVTSTSSGIKTKRETLASLWNAANSPLRKDMDAHAHAEEMHEEKIAVPPTVTNISKRTDPETTMPDATGALQNVTADQNQNQKQTGTLRLVKELRKAKEEKQEAMKRLTRLETEIMDLRLKREAEKDTVTRGRERGRGMDRGRRVSRQPGGRGRGGDDDDDDDGENSITPDRRNRNRRMKSPEPSGRNRPELDPLADGSGAVAQKAVQTVEDVFVSDFATYIVRKPYQYQNGNGNDSMVCNLNAHVEDEDVLGFGSVASPPVSWVDPVETYGKNASAKEEKSLEVIARIKADGSILLIWGASSCRHGIPTLGDGGAVLDYEYKTFDDVEYMDGSLGKILYIDAEGNDGEYWLDPIYEEALKIRESYCSNVFSAALALKAASASMSMSTSTSVFSPQEEQSLPSPTIASTTVGGPTSSLLHSNNANSNANASGHQQQQFNDQKQRVGSQFHPNPQSQQSQPQMQPNRATMSAMRGEQPIPSTEPRREEVLSPPISSKVEPTGRRVDSTSDPKPLLNTSRSQPGEVKTEKGNASSSKHEQKPVQKPKQEKQRSEPEEEQSGSVDVLPAFFIFFFSTIFNIIWFVIMLPVRVARIGITVALVLVISHLMWVYLADNQDALRMGAIIDTQYNI